MVEHEADNTAKLVSNKEETFMEHFLITLANIINLAL
jgi:hypothetical protein